MKLTDENINDLLEEQLQRWDLAKGNFDNLMHIKRKNLEIKDFNAIAQLNPARIKSTAADISKEGISKRPCFLCRDNRPAEQFGIEWIPGWELLVNPYPILPVHFTIASTRHIPQAEIPLDMASMAEQAPSLVIFFNGASAGASAPDHMHCQAVLKTELPIIHIVEKYHKSDNPGWKSSDTFGIDLPFNFMSAVVSPDIDGLYTLSRVTKGFGIGSDGIPDKNLINVFSWIADDGLLRIILIPRRAHRPSCYFMKGGEQLIVSPGALDMAGLLILPREEDFFRIDSGSARKIYSEVGFPGKLPPQITYNFK